MKKKKENIYKNTLEFFETFNKLKLMAMNLFKWKGLPETVDEEYLEETLLSKGFAIGFVDNSVGNLALAGSPTANLNVYSKPTKYQVNGNNYQKILNVSDVVVIKNNNLKLAVFDVLENYAEKIAETQRTIDVLLNTHKTPHIIVADDKTVFSLKVAYKKIIENEQVIVVDKGMGIDSIKTLPTEPTFIIDKLVDYKRTLWAEALSFLGVNNPAIDKKERLVVDEATSNEDEIELNLETMIQARKESAEKLSELWGTSISVDLKFKKNEAKPKEKGDDDFEY